VRYWWAEVPPLMCVAERPRGKSGDDSWGFRCRWPMVRNRTFPLSGCRNAGGVMLLATPTYRGRFWTRRRSPDHRARRGIGQTF
jgi:hypothetical protein